MACGLEEEIPGKQPVSEAILSMVITADIREITASSGSTGGEVSTEGSQPVTARGIVWGTQENTSLDDYEGKTTDGAGSGTFSSLVSGLEPETIYYYRAYATSAVGTSYGEERVFSTIDEPLSLDDWITGHPRIQRFMNWDGTNYTHWPESRKNQLQLYYTMRKTGLEDLSDYPPENLYLEEMLNDPVTTHYREEDAIRLYLMNVANSIYMERNQLLSWSLLSDDYSDLDMEILLDGAHFIQGYVDEGMVNMQQWVLPSPPQYAISFLQEARILAPDSRKETVYRMVDWSSVYMIHFTGGLTMYNFFNHWGYKGAIPVTALIEGRPLLSNVPGLSGLVSYTAGCHGTNVFFQSVLRAVNIPVEYIYYAEHALPRFGGDNLYLSHGDSPYSQIYTYADPSLNPAQLLLDAETWYDWFRADGVESTHNIGRREYELGVEYITNGLLMYYCRNQSGGQPYEESGFYTYLSRFYSAKELEDLRKEMDEKIISLGGCHAIPYTKVRYYLD